jgi:outer membrane receptor protein involved in Fe transport
VSARWQVIDTLAFRGSIGTTFRGPTAGNLSPNFATGLAPFAATNNQFRSVDFFGNPSLEPETATTWSAGAIFELGGFRAIVDFWNYDIEDPIVSVPASAVVAQVANGGAAATTNCASPFAALITFATGPCANGVSLGADIARVRSDTVNGPKTKVSGIDFQFDYGIDDFGGGSLSFGLSGSYINEYSIDAFTFLGATLEGARQVEGTASYNRFPGPVNQWRGNIFASYRRGPVNVRYEVQYVDGLFDERGPSFIPIGATADPDGAGPIAAGCTARNQVNGTTCLLNTYGWPNIDSWMSHNIYLVWDLPWDAALSASLTNIGNEQPSQTRTEYGYDPSVGNPLGRTFEVGVRKRF